MASALPRPLLVLPCRERQCLSNTETRIENLMPANTGWRSRVRIYVFPRWLPSLLVVLFTHLLDLTASGLRPAITLAITANSIYIREQRIF